MRPSEGLVKYMEMCLAEFLIHNRPGKVVIESKCVHSLSPTQTHQACFVHTHTHAHVHTHLLTPGSSPTRVTPDNDFPLQAFPAHGPVSALFPAPQPHRTLPPWQFVWKVLLGLGEWATCARGFVVS